MPEQKDRVIVREVQEADNNFIMATWLKGLYFGNSWFREIPQDIYFRNYHAVIEKIVSRPKVRIKVACLELMPDAVLGYCVYEGPIIHWIFVKSSYREVGIAKMIVPDGITQCSHITHIGRSLKRKKDIIFNPFFEESL